MPENANIFDQVLMQGEQVIRTFKPNKKRFWLSRLSHIPGLIFFLIFPMIFLIMYLTESGPFQYIAGSPIPSFVLPVIIVVIVGIPVFFTLLEIVYGVFWYRNRLYCFTNRRIMIQCGVFGRNFRFMDLQWAANSFVHISLLDRMMRQNTGSIKFSNMASPMMNMHSGSMHQQGFAGAMFYFLYVEQPHDILREIQEQASALQMNSANQMQNLANQMGNLANQFGQQNQNFNNNMNNGFNNQNMNGMNNGFNNNQGFNNNMNGNFNNNQNMNGNFSQNQNFNEPNQNPNDPNNNNGFGDGNNGW